MSLIPWDPSYYWRGKNATSSLFELHTEGGVWHWLTEAKITDFPILTYAIISPPDVLLQIYSCVFHLSDLVLLLLYFGYKKSWEQRRPALKLHQKNRLRDYEHLEIVNVLRHKLPQMSSIDNLANWYLLSTSISLQESKPSVESLDSFYGFLMPHWS